MTQPFTKLLIPAIFLAFLFSISISEFAKAAQDETLTGYIVKRGKTFFIEAEDGDYIIKGKDVSKMVNRLVEVTGTITQSDKGEVIEVKSIMDVQDSEPD